MYSKGSFNISMKKNPAGPSKGKQCDPRCEWLTRGTDRPALGITLVLCGQERKTAQCSWLTFSAHPIMFKIPEWCALSASIWTTAPFSMMKERTECGKPAWEIYVFFFFLSKNLPELWNTTATGRRVKCKTRHTCWYMRIQDNWPCL